MKLITALIVSLSLFAAPAMAQQSSNAGSDAQANNNITFGGGSSSSVSAPGLAIGVGSCARGNSGGIAFGGVSIALGGTVVDAKCDTRQDMLALHATQQGPDVVRARACGDEDMAAAYALAGNPCPTPALTVAQAVQQLNNGNPIWDVGQNRWRYR